MPSSLDKPEDPRWQEAERRDLFLRGLLKASGWKATGEVVEAARNAFGAGIIYPRKSGGNFSRAPFLSAIRSPQRT